MSSKPSDNIPHHGSQIRRVRKFPHTSYTAWADLPECLHAETRPSFPRGARYSASSVSSARASLLLWHADRSAPCFEIGSDQTHSSIPCASVPPLQPAHFDQPHPRHCLGLRVPAPRQDPF